MNKKSALFILILISQFYSFSQDTIVNRNSRDTIIYYFTNNNICSFLPAYSAPDTSWFKPEFDDSSWLTDSATIGFGYGGNGYTVIDANCKSLYARISFNVSKKETIKQMNLIVDYDDGYIAYLNGTEIARVNIDKSVLFPPYNASATRSHASEYAMGITSPVLGVYLDSVLLSECLVNGENILAFHIVNDTLHTNLMFIPALLDISKINKKYEGFFAVSNLRYKSLVEIDSSNIPIVKVETDLYGIPYNKSWTTAQMKIINNNPATFITPSDTSFEYNGLVSIKLRGQSSRDFAKQSYRFELVDDNLADTSFALLDMPEERDWILSGPFADKSLVRNKFVYDLASRLGHYAPRSRFCELIINDQPVGLYLLTEEVKRGKNRVNISKLTETDITGFDVTGGYLFKYDKAPHPTGSFIKGREIVYPDPEVMKPEQSYYIKRFFTVYDSVLTKTNDFNDPVKGFRKYASDSSLADFFIINEITKNADAYLTSTYMYKDRDDKDGRMKFGPVWDYDLAFGNTTFQKGNQTDGWQFEVNPGTMYTTRYFQDTAFVHLFKNRWHQMRKKAYSNDSILGYFDELIAQIESASVRNYKIWPVIDQSIFYPGYYMDSYEYEIAYTKEWIIKRMEWIDNNIDKIYFPLIKVGKTELSTAGNYYFKLYPNPFIDNLTLGLNVEESTDIKVQIIDLNGRTRSQAFKNIHSGYNEMSIGSDVIAQLEKGIYFIKIFVDNNFVETLKVLKN